MKFTKTDCLNTVWQNAGELRWCNICWNDMTTLQRLQCAAEYFEWHKDLLILTWPEIAAKIWRGEKP